MRPGIKNRFAVFCPVHLDFHDGLVGHFVAVSYTHLGQGAAIYAEIIRQLLTVKGDREVRALGLRSLDGDGYKRQPQA